MQSWSPQHCDVKLNVWDFGGQEMLRGTHRFFLTERSLYLLLLTIGARTIAPMRAC